jgi:hypothetical protein
MVLLWFHPEYGEPTFRIPSLPEMASPAWRPSRRFTYRVRTNLCELNENIFDTAHFMQVHGYLDLPAAEITWNGPVVDVVHRTRGRLFGRTMDAVVRNEVYGAGYQVVRVDTEINFIIVTTKTPLDAERVEERFAITLRKTFPGLDRILERWLVARVDGDARRDHRIFENKRYLPRPLLADGDGPVHKFRRWYAQFDTARTAAALGGEPAE